MSRTLPQSDRRSMVNSVVTIGVRLLRRGAPFVPTASQKLDAIFRCGGLVERALPRTTRRDAQMVDLGSGMAVVLEHLYVVPRGRLALLQPLGTRSIHFSLPTLSCDRFTMTTSPFGCNHFGMQTCELPIWCMFMRCLSCYEICSKS